VKAVNSSLLSLERSLTARLISTVMLALSYNIGLAGLLRDFITNYVGCKGVA